MFILSFETAHHIFVMNDFFFQKKIKIISKYVFNHKSQSSFHNTIFKYYEVYKLTSNLKHKTDKKHEKKKNIDEKSVFRKNW